MEKKIYKEDIGYKAYNLYILKQNKINVPEFLVIDSTTLDKYFSSILKNKNKVLKKIDYKNNIQVEECSSTIFELVNRVSNKFIEQEILEKVNASFYGKKIAIRISVVAENIENSSFASKLKGYLNIDAKDVINYIKKCYKSLYDVDALKYYNKNNIDARKIRIALIVQEMIDSDVTGITFTANPRGILNEAVTLVGIESGIDFKPDETVHTAYYYNKDEDVGYYETKDISPLLDNISFNNIMDVCLKIEKLYNKNLDIEWALIDKEIYILQVRPLTTIKKEEKISVLDNRCVSRYFKEVTLPLTTSVITDMCNGIIEEVIKKIVGDKRAYIDINEFKNMLQSVNGRIYCNISKLYSAMNILPHGDKLVKIWQDIHGISDIKYDFNSIKIDTLDNIKIKNRVNRLLKNSNQKVEELIDKFAKIFELYKETFNENMNNISLVKLYEVIEKCILLDYYILVLNQISIYTNIAILKDKLKQNNEETSNKYSYINLIKGTLEIFQEINFNQIFDYIDERIKEQLYNISSEEEALEYINSDTELSKILKEYLNRYTDTEFSDLRIEACGEKISYQYMIAQILRLLDNTNIQKESSEYLMSLNLDKKDILCINNLKDKIITLLNSSNAAIYNIFKIKTVFRNIFLAIGKNLCDDGKLREVCDIWYFTKQELFGFILENKYINFDEVLKIRKESYSKYFEMPNYSRIDFTSNISNKVHKNINLLRSEYDLENLYGYANCSKKIRGEVIAFNNNLKIEDVRGKIIISKDSSFKLNSILKYSKGVILECGNILSTTAIMCSEYNVMYLFGVENIEKILKNGQIIEIDGKNGKISVVEE